MAFGIKGLLLFGAIMVVSATTGRIFFKKMTDQMPRYPFFLVLFITAIAVPFYFITLAIKTYQYKRKGASLHARYLPQSSIQSRSSISEPSRTSTAQEGSLMMSIKRYTHAHTFPKLKLALMGFLDSCASNLMVFGGHGTSGPLQALLSQGVIPIVLVLSVVFMKTRYTWNQYLGAFLVLSGVFIVFAPNLFVAEGAIYWPLMTFAANLPTAVSSVLKEFSFKQALINVYYMQAWVALFQFLSSLLLFPLNIIPHFGQLTIQEVPENMLDAVKCFLSLPTSHGAADNCELAWLPVVGYAICNFVFNITSLYVIKELSSAVVYIQNAIRLPLITVAFHLTFIMGSAALPWDYTSFYLFGGLAVIIIGLIGYMFTSVKELRAKMAALSVGERSPLIGSDSWDSSSPSEPSSPILDPFIDETLPISIINTEGRLFPGLADPVAISESI